jgi:predicted nucleotidyltransferase
MNKKLQKEIDLAVKILKEAGAKEVYLFGSILSGKFLKTSDVDLAVAGLPPEKYFAVMARMTLALKIPFDLVDLDEPSPFVTYLKDKGQLRHVG